MSYATIALFVVIIAQAIAAYFALRETRKLRTKLIRLRKTYDTLVFCDEKNNEFIQKLIKTNQAQAKKIRTLKNRISF